MIPKISIIIPVYNVERYLRQCLDSVKDQTFRDIEIICIDDGSVDTSGEICEEYAQRDSRFLVKHQPNTGQSAARNRGLDLARGKYILFVDSDDWIDLTLCEKTYTSAQATGADITAFAFFYMGVKKRIRPRKRTHQELITDPMDKCIFSSQCHFINWNRLYNRDFLTGNGIRYLDVLSSEDTHFTVKAAILANGIYFIPEPMYYYRYGIGFSRDVKQVVKRMSMIEMYASMTEEFFRMNLPESLMDMVLLWKYRAYSHMYRRDIPQELKANCRGRILSAIQDWEWERIGSGRMNLPMKSKYFLYWIRGGWVNMLKHLFK